MEGFALDTSRKLVKQGSSMSLLRDPKRLLAILVAIIAGLIVLIDLVADWTPIDDAATILVEWAGIIAALALLIGLISLTGSHLSRIRQRGTDWPYSLLLILAMVTVVLVGIFFPLPGRNGIVLPTTLAETPIRTLFRTVYEPLAASLRALLAFFSLSAALRALRRGSGEGLVIVTVAVLVLLTQIPAVGTWIPLLGPTIQWLNDSIALAGARGLLLGTTIGALVAGIRVMLGFDTPYLDR